MTKTVDKPRALQHKGNLGKSRIIMIPKRKEYRMIQTTIRIPVELHKRLKELAKKKGLTVNALIVQGCGNYRRIYNDIKIQKAQ